MLSECSSTFDDIICVVTSASAATPAPQQLQNSRTFKSPVAVQSTFDQDLKTVNKQPNDLIHSLDFGCNVVDLHTVLISNDHIIRGPGVCS